MKRKKITWFCVIIFVVLLLAVPIPLKASADGSVKVLQSLTYKLITTNDGKTSETKAFFFPNNFKNTEELLSDDNDSSNSSSTNQNDCDFSSEAGGGNTQVPDNIGGMLDELDELSELTEGELNNMQIVPKEAFKGKVFGCGFDGKESVPATIIKSVSDLNSFISGPTSKISDSNGGNKNGAFLKYAGTLDEDFFKNRSLIVKYYYSKNDFIPNIESVAGMKNTIVVAVSLQKLKTGESDLRGCLLIVDIDKQYLNNIKSYKFMIMPVIQKTDKVPLGGK